jgi:hypothetical protein
MSSDLTAIRDRLGDLEAYAGVRLVTLGDGHERGVRVLEFRSGGGLEFEVVVDRGFDVGRLSVNGQACSWHSPTGLRAPWLHDRSSDGGQGFLRGFSGLLMTCGLDHIRQPEAVAAESPLHPSGTIDHPLHGNGTLLAGQLLGYGIAEGPDGPILWCEGEMRQAMVFGACLSLRRRISCAIGSNTFEIRDHVENIGATPAPHLLLYHINFGYPLLDAGALPRLSPAKCIWQSHAHDPFAPFPAPTELGRSELTVHAFDVSSGEARCAIENPATGARVEISFDPRELPFTQLLRQPGRRLYLAAIEPCTTGQHTQTEAARHGEVRRLEPGEGSDYTLRLAFTAAKPS